MTDIHYWFYIEPFVHISLKSNNVLLYNTLNNEILEYFDNIEVSKIIKQLLIKRNLRIIKITETELNNKKIFDFISITREYFMGDLLKTSWSKKKPIQFTPLVKVNNNRAYFKNQIEESNYSSNGIANYLNEISIYVNNEPSNESLVLGSVYKQFLSVYSDGNKYCELNLSDFEKLLDEAKESGLRRINILGGNIFNYSNINNLIKLLNEIPVVIRYFFYYSDLKEGNIQVLKRLNTENSSIILLSDFNINTLKFKNTLNLLLIQNLNFKINFIISNQRESVDIGRIIKQYNINNYTIIPYYNGRNVNYFKESVIITKKDILASKPKERDIFIKMHLNPLNFGKLTIFSDGSIYSNVNEKKLGLLSKDSLFDVLNNEMLNGKSWFKLRSKVEPCKNCVYEYICPPISNYETVIGINNLCNIYK